MAKSIFGLNLRTRFFLERRFPRNAVTSTRPWFSLTVEKPSWKLLFWADLELVSQNYYFCQTIRLCHFCASAVLTPRLYWWSKNSVIQFDKSISLKLEIMCTNEKHFRFSQKQLIFHSELFLIRPYPPDKPKANMASLGQFWSACTSQATPNQKFNLQYFPSLVTISMQKHRHSLIRSRETDNQCVCWLL